MCSFIFFDTTRHLQLEHNVLARYNDLAKEFVLIDPTAHFSNQSENESFPPTSTQAYHTYSA